MGHGGKILNETGNDMYKERMFDTWTRGMLHLVIEVFLPIFPIMVYVLNHGTGESYLYVLLLTVLVTFLYEMMLPTEEVRSTFLKVESIVCITALIIMLLGASFLLLAISTSESGVSDWMKDMCFWLLWGFVAPVLITVIEIIRAARWDIKFGKYQLEKQNIVRGAGNV